MSDTSLAHSRTNETPIEREVARRRTFAIISHPDAGKTTLTEKLLLFGGAINLAGEVKAKKNRINTRSDWMAIERERGISVVTSVMTFEFGGLVFNLLDTPGHEDFSEDTYRTLTAVDSAVMVIDAAKGIEARTRKLFEVCRLRDIPIVTFINKMDRESRDPFEILDEIEKTLALDTAPVTWPIGRGRDFAGTIELSSGGVRRLEADANAAREQMNAAQMAALSPNLDAAALEEELMLAKEGTKKFELAPFREGHLTPVFFGSALKNFGVRDLLEALGDYAPRPRAQAADKRTVEAAEPKLTAFVFKIQANMDPAHRDRVAFLRVVSGKYEKGMSANHSRLGKSVRLAKPSQFMAAERTAIEDAWPGDVIGLFDPGQYRIGDSLVEGDTFEFEGVPRFSPEHFAIVRSKDPLKRKQMQKGLEQLAEEGTIQVFEQLQMGMKDPIVGVVGALQFEVLQYRVEHEYGANIVIDRLPFSQARWVVGEKFEPKTFDWEGNRQTVQDRDGLPLVLFRDEWALQHAEEKHPELKFLSAAPQMKGTQFVSVPA